MATYALDKVRQLWQQEALTEQSAAPSSLATSGTVDRGSTGAPKSSAGVAAGAEDVG